MKSLPKQINFWANVVARFLSYQAALSDTWHLDGDWVVCAPPYSRIVCSKCHQTPMHGPYASHDSTARHLFLT